MKRAIFLVLMGLAFLPEAWGEAPDAETARNFIARATAFLMDQVREDGSFVYGVDPSTGQTLEGYNILRHAGTVWALCQGYRMRPSPELAELIGRCVHYMLAQVVCGDGETAYLYDAASGEIKLGGCGLGVLALTEYMDVMGSDRHTGDCRALGNGILSMISGGRFIHVLNRDFSPKAAYRTVYYDGEAAFALVRLYELTGERSWLEAACWAADRLTAGDHWTAYALNGLTAHADRPEYWALALENARAYMAVQDTGEAVGLELLMAAFETWIRMEARGVRAEGFDLPRLLAAIQAQAEGQAEDGLFPESGARRDRLRIDDVQHAIGGCYLYWKNYGKLLQCGMEAEEHGEAH